jgi:hypothetical protein
MGPTPDAIRNAFIYNVEPKTIMVKEGQTDNLLRFITKSRNNILAFLAYSVLSIIFTYPVAFSSAEVPGNCDVYQFLWILWWFKEALLGFANPYYTAYMFYPNGVNLAFTELTPFNSIASIPLQLLFGLVAAYNILWIFSFIISGLGAFLLVKYLTKDSRAAFVSGLIFAFCPYHFAHGMGHLNLITTEWIPFFVLFFIKTLNEDKKINAIYAGMLLLLAMLSTYYYLIYLFIFILLYIFYHYSTNRNFSVKGIAERMTIMMISFGIIALPFLYPILKELLTANSGYMYGGGFVEFSADLVGFFIPTIFHPLFKGFVSPIYANFTGNAAENTVFIGYIVLLLSAVALLKSKNKEVKFWTVSALTFFILSLGPILHVNGIVKLPLEATLEIPILHLGIRNLFIPLPYAILQFIPLFSLARVPSRWTILLMLSLCILSGFGLEFIFKSLKIKSFCKMDSRSVLTLIVSIIILFEFLAIPYPMGSTKVPLFYQNIKNDTEDYALLEFPAIDYAKPLYYQTSHGKKLVGGYVSRTSEDNLKFIRSTPLICQLFNRSLELSESSNQNLTERGISALYHYKIKYIILHNDALTPDEYNYYNASLKRILKENPVIYNNDNLVVYKIGKNQTWE